METQRIRIARNEQYGLHANLEPLRRGRPRRNGPASNRSRGARIVSRNRICFDSRWP
jgi:hypothetical protein